MFKVLKAYLVGKSQGNSVSVNSEHCGYLHATFPPVVHGCTLSALGISFGSLN